MWVFASLCSQKHFYRNTRGFINLYLGCVIITTKKKIVVLVANEKALVHIHDLQA